MADLTLTDIISIAEQIVESMRANFVPNPKTRYKTSTGNMAFDALKYDIQYGSGEGPELVIYIDEDVAPYVFYTNEPWISPKWNGKQNQNEGWWDNTFVPEFMRRFAAALKGELVKV